MRREALLARLRAKAALAGRSIGAGAGTGLSAKCAEAGGADLIIIYNSGRYRMAGRGSLAGLMPYGDANAIVMEMAGEVLPVVRDVPVLAGVCGTDPFRLMPRFLDELAAAWLRRGAELPHRRAHRRGVPAEPGRNRDELRLRSGHDPAGRRARAPHLPVRLRPRAGRADGPGRGRHRRPAHGADHLGHDRGADRADPGRGGRPGAGHAATRRSRSSEDILVLCHGGPIAEPQDAGYVLARTTGVCGFFGASSMERLPVERALTAQVRAFTELSLPAKEQA